MKRVFVAAAAAVAIVGCGPSADEKRAQEAIKAAQEAGEAARQAGQAARDAGVRKVTVQALPGDPGEVLLEAAKDFDADLIVVGSRGLTSHAHFILGSVAASVAHHAPCDVPIAHTTA